MGLFERKIKEFPKIIDWVGKLDVDALAKFVLNADVCNRMFIASGGTYSAAAFAELLSIERGLMSKALTPMIYSGSRYHEIAANTLLLSASGNNMDIRRAYKICHESGRQGLTALVLSEKGGLQEDMRKTDSRLLSYKQPTGNDGFLSTTTVLAFYLLLYKAYGYSDIDKLQEAIADADMDNINAFVQSLKSVPFDELTDHEVFLHKLEGIDSFFVLYGAKSYPVALDIESKFSEGALGNTQLADFRNFAHGRFNWFTQRPGQTGLICLQHPDDVEMSEELLGMLPMHVPTLRLRTKHASLLGSIDLLIKEHYLCSAIGEKWGLDISRPVVPEYGRILHRK